MAYRYTGIVRFLEYAENVTSYWSVRNACIVLPDSDVLWRRLSSVPSNGVPKWDFDAVSPNAEVDSSAAAIAASAMLELHRYTGNVTYYDQGLDPRASLSHALMPIAALLTLTSLATTYLASTPGSEAVLSHCKWRG